MSERHALCQSLLSTTDNKLSISQLLVIHILCLLIRAYWTALTLLTALGSIHSLSTCQNLLNRTDFTSHGNMYALSDFQNLMNSTDFTALVSIDLMSTFQSLLNSTDLTAINSIHFLSTSHSLLNSTDLK